MRALLTSILICFLSLSTIAQDNVNLKKMVGFGCYYEGRYTKTVIKVTELIEAKKYKDISKLLTSRNSGERYLAVISLERLVDNGLYNLNNNEKSIIVKLKPSDDMVSVCSGCTYFNKVPMKTILTERDLIGSNHWLDRTIKRE